jgi:hypothetical protein
VSIETEPYVLLPRGEQVELHGKDRLRVSKRRAAALANAGMTPSEAARQVAAGITRSGLVRDQVEGRTVVGGVVVTGRGEDRRDRDRFGPRGNPTR